MPLGDLNPIRNLIAIAGGEGDDEPPMIGPARWGPASWWRLGLVAMAVMILVLLFWRIFA